MAQNNSKQPIGKLDLKNRRGVAEVISSLLLIVITVVGAVILTGFIDETFVSGSLAVVSGSDTTQKTIKLRAYDTRNGDQLMGSPDYALDNRNPPPPPPLPLVDSVLCRVTCAAETTPDQGGTDFMVIQIENKSINPIFLKGVHLDGVVHFWDSDTVLKPLNTLAVDSLLGDYPSDGGFSILSNDPTDKVQGDRKVESGQTVDLLIKLDNTNDDIELSKTMRVQVNIGENSLADFLIETGDAR